MLGEMAFASRPEGIVHEFEREPPSILHLSADAESSSNFREIDNDNLPNWLSSWFGVVQQWVTARMTTLNGRHPRFVVGITKYNG
jgi:hypothetical protein